MHDQKQSLHRGCLTVRQMLEYKRQRFIKGSIYFTVYGIAIGKQMPRVVRLASGGSRAFKPKPTQEWESSIAGQAYKYRPEVPFDEPMALGCLFFRPMPAYIVNSKRKYQDALSFKLLPDKKPDVKNLVASVEDALEGVFWKNDSCIVQYIGLNNLPFGKYYGETPRIEIVIIPIRLLHKGD